MNDDDPGNDDLLDELADEFVTRKQAGEAPTVSEYCLRYPALESQIKELFPALDLLENVKPESDLAENGRPSHPEKIGQYRILRRIGHGGMGVVYEAEHESLGRRVALKVVAPRVSQDDRARARFQREARAVAKLHHTNIVPLFEVGEDGGQLFLAMQMIRGQSLDRVFAKLREENYEALETPPDPSPVGDKILDALRLERDGSGKSDGSSVARSTGTGSGDRRHFHWIARIGLQAADALQYAHQRGIIHRDIKPSNLILDDSAVVWLTDFGLAKTDDEELTQTGDMLGTLRYIAPERFQHDCDERADVYGLGLTLYEMLTQRPAFQSSDRFQLIDRICRSDLPRIATLNPQVPRDLETIVLKACDRNPTSRYQSAGELAQDLRCFLSDQPIKARRHSMPERLYRWSRRNRAVAALLGAVSLLLVTATIGSAIAAAIFRSQGEQIRHYAGRAEQQAELAQQQRDAALWQQYRATITAAAVATYDSGSSNSMVAQLLEQAPKEYRGWEWYYLNSQRDSSILQLRSRMINLKDSPAPVAYGPQGKRFAFCGRQGIELWNTSNWQQPQAVLEGFEDGAVAVGFNAYGTRLIATYMLPAWDVDRAHLTVRIWDTNERRLLAEIGKSENEPAESGWPNFALSRDGLKVGFSYGRQTVRIVSTRDGQLLATHNLPDERTYDLRFSPDGDQIAVGCGSLIRIIDATTGEVQISLTDGFEAFAHRIAFSPDGKRLAAAGGNYPAFDIRLWQLDSGTLIATMQGHVNVVDSLTFNTDGTRLLSADRNGLVLLWEGKNGSRIAALRGHRNRITTAEFSRDGALIATGSEDASLRLWDGSDGTPLAILRGSERQINQVAFNPGGNQLAASDGMAGKVHIWDLASLGGILRGHTSYVYAVDVSPDDKHIASAAWDGTLRIWDLASGQIEDVLNGEVNRYLSAAYSPDGTVVAAGTGEGTIHIWDIDRREKRVLGADERWFGDRMPVAFSPDAQSVAFADGHGEVAVWDWANGTRQPVCALGLGDVDSLAFTPGGRELIIGTEGQAQVWNVKTRDRVCDFGEKNSRTEVRAMACSADQRWVAFGGTDNHVQVWDLKTKDSVATLEHPSIIHTLAFNPKQTRLAAGCHDGTIRLWDTKTWEQVAILSGHSAYVHGLTFTHDGTRLISGSGDTTVRIWDTVPVSQRHAQSTKPPTAGG